MESMDIDNPGSDFDNKENSYLHSNVLPRTPCTEKGYEELDVSELNMKLRYSITPASSPMSKSYTAHCLDNRPFDPDCQGNENMNLTRSLNTTMTKSNSLKNKTLPLQILPTDLYVDCNRNTTVLQPLTTSTVPDNNITVTISSTNDVDENLSLPSSSSSVAHTPEAITPTKEISKSDGGSPIMRGLKSVLNMFRPSQSPIIPAGDEEKTFKPEILSPDIASPKNDDKSISPAMVSTPISTNKSKEVNSSKRSSPLKDSIVFNDDLEKELLWKDETTILFSHEKIPIHKLFFQQTKTMTDVNHTNTETEETVNFDNLLSEVEKLASSEKLDTTVEYMDISYNDSVLTDKTMTEIQTNSTFNQNEIIATGESDSEFLDCETTFTRDDSHIIEDQYESNGNYKSTSLQIEELIPNSATVKSVSQEENVSNNEVTSCMGDSQVIKGAKLIEDNDNVIETSNILSLSIDINTSVENSDVTKVLMNEKSNTHHSDTVSNIEYTNSVGDNMFVKRNSENTQSNEPILTKNDSQIIIDQSQVTNLESNTYVKEESTNDTTPVKFGRHIKDITCQNDPQISDVNATHTFVKADSVLKNSTNEIAFMTTHYQPIDDKYANQLNESVGYMQSQLFEKDDTIVKEVPVFESLASDSTSLKNDSQVVDNKASDSVLQNLVKDHTTVKENDMTNIPISETMITQNYNHIFNNIEKKINNMTTNKDNPESNISINESTFTKGNNCNVAVNEKMNETEGKNDFHLLTNMKEIVDSNKMNYDLSLSKVETHENNINDVTENVNICQTQHNYHINTIANDSLQINIFDKLDDSNNRMDSLNVSQILDEKIKYMSAVEEKNVHVEGLESVEGTDIHTEEDESVEGKVNVNKSLDPKLNEIPENTSTMQLGLNDTEENTVIKDVNGLNVDNINPNLNLLNIPQNQNQNVGQSCQIPLKVENLLSVEQNKLSVNVPMSPVTMENSREQGHNFHVENVDNSQFVLPNISTKTLVEEKCISEIHIRPFKPTQAISELQVDYGEEGTPADIPLPDEDAFEVEFIPHPKSQFINNEVQQTENKESICSIAINSEILTIDNKNKPEEHNKTEAMEHDITPNFKEEMDFIKPVTANSNLDLKLDNNKLVSPDSKLADQGYIFEINNLNKNSLSVNNSLADQCDISEYNAQKPSTRKKETPDFLEEYKPKMSLHDNVNQKQFALNENATCDETSLSQGNQLQQNKAIETEEIIDVDTFVCHEITVHGEKNIETPDEKIIVSENNSPYVSVSSGTDLISRINTKENFEEMKNTFTTKSFIATSPPLSPKISPKKGYNFNFDEMEDPFTTNTKIRMSPTPNTSPSAFKAVDSKKEESRHSLNNNKNRRKLQPERKSPSLTKSKMNSTFDLSRNGVKELRIEDIESIVTEDKKNEDLNNDRDQIVKSHPDFQDKSETEIPEITKSNKTLENCSNKIDAELGKALQSEINNTIIFNAEIDENIHQRDKNKLHVVFDGNKNNSSSEHSVYFSAGTSSSENFESKNVFNLPEINDMNFNPFKTKSRIRESPPSSLRCDPIDVDRKTMNSSNGHLSSEINTAQDIKTKNYECSEQKPSFQETESSSPISNENCSLNFIYDKDVTIRTVHTEDEDTVEGPFIEAENVDDVGDLFIGKSGMDQFSELSNQLHDENTEGAELFIDAEAFEFLLNKNQTNVVTNSGKESLFLKFDPLYARRLSPDGIVAALSQIQKRQSTPKKLSQPPYVEASIKKSPIPGPSTLNFNEEIFVNNILEESVEEQNTTVSKPVMVVTPAVNPVATQRNSKSTAPQSSNRRSLMFTSPAMAVIDRLLSLSGNNSLLGNESITEATREHNEADLALTQLRELLAEKEVHVCNLRAESKELKDRLTTLETQMRTLENESQERLKKMNELNENLSEKTKINKSMASVVEEYERTIASLIAETEQDKKRHAEERAQLIREKDEQTAHLASMEVSFSDLHSKYEKSKQIIVGCKTNEETYKKSIKEFEENFNKMQNNYELLKQHATSKLNHANQELEKMNRAHEAEILKLNAMIKRKELHVTSLEETLAQKTKVNEELTAICDELINKVS